VKFKDTQIGDRLTVWQMSQRRYVVKVADDQAVVLSSGELIHIHKNKDVEVSERLSPDWQIGLYQNEVVICRKLDTQHYHAVNVTIVENHILKSSEVHIVKEQPKDLTQVYIIMNVIKKKFGDLQAMIQTLEVLIEEATGGDTPPANYIMSTTPPQTSLELPGE
jgi:methylthioribose-1-phosphate isomerase